MKIAQSSKLPVLCEGNALVDSRPKGPVPCHDVFMAAGYLVTELTCPVPGHVSLPSDAQ